MAEEITKRRVLLGITGSIAAYKSAKLARLFVSKGYEVRVVMTEAAQKFITEHTLQALTGNPVTKSFWDEANPGTISHIELADWADVMIIAPATASCLAKLVQGEADEPLYAIHLATRAPLVVAPAMNVNMYEHPAVQANVKTLQERGVCFVEPDVGDLACGWTGTGRLAHPWEIYHATLSMISERDFVGRHVLITTGPTREAIDPVRFISNRSSGKMGIALAREAYRRGARVTLIHGPVEVRAPRGIERVPVISSQEMYDAVFKRAFPKSGIGPDVVIMAAAVADYRPTSTAPEKIKKKKGQLEMNLEMHENADILAELGKARADNDRPILVGFAVETGEVEQLLEELERKLREKHADMIIGNFAEEAFEGDQNRVWMLDRYGKCQEIALTYKSRVANRILNRVAKL